MWRKSARGDDCFLDRPVTISELAWTIGPRRLEFHSEKSTQDLIAAWMERGVYGVRLQSWPVVGGTRMTTLRHYINFRHTVSNIRRQKCQKLLRFLRQRRSDASLLGGGQNGSDRMSVAM